MPSLLIIKAAKALLRLRIKAAGSWTYYANPRNCLYGPQSGVSSWDWVGSSQLESVCVAHGIPFQQYTDLLGTPCAQVLTTAKALAARWDRFTSHVLNWQPVPNSTTYWGDNSVTHEEVASTGTRRTVTDRCASGDIC